MSPQDLTEYIKVLREGNVASAHIVMATYGRDATPEQINIVFNPEPVPGGTTPVPGGWKSPQTLDSNAIFEHPDHEV